VRRRRRTAWCPAPARVRVDGGLDGPPLGVDAGDLRLNELDAPRSQTCQRPASLLEGTQSDDVPQLRQAREEAVAVRDHRDTVFVSQARAQLVRGGQPAEPGAEDQTAANAGVSDELRATARLGTQVRPSRTPLELEGRAPLLRDRIDASDKSSADPPRSAE
jgi:hypothetical protein